MVNRKGTYSARSGIVYELGTKRIELDGEEFDVLCRLIEKTKKIINTEGVMEASFSVKDSSGK